MTTIREVMKQDLCMIDEDSTLGEACRIMGDKHIGAIIVTSKGNLCGIFTERDLLSRALRENADINTEKVGKYASRPLITIEPGTNVREAAKIMSDMKIKRLLVMEDEKIIGIFTSSDLTDALAKSPLDF